MTTSQQGEANPPIPRYTSPLARTVSLLSRLSPALTSRVAAQLFVSPQPYKLSEFETDVLQSGIPLSIHSGSRRVHGWRWGGGPAVLLIHGWSGSSGQFAGLVRALIRSRYSVLAFDLPAHGASEGRITNLSECMKAVRTIADTYGPFHGVVGHSFGGLALALSTLELEFTNRLVLVSPLLGANAALRKFGTMCGLNDDIQNRMRDHFEQKIGMPFADFDLGSAADKLKVPTLVIHDKRDRVVPFEESDGWVKDCDEAELFPTEGLGHQRILADQEVAQRITAFFGKGKVDIRTALLSEFAL